MKLILSFFILLAFAGCQKNTYIVFKGSNYSDTIKLGKGLIVTNYDIPEISLDTAYLNKYLKQTKPSDK